MKKRIISLSVLALILAAACAIPLRAADAASGSLSATSRYLYIPSGLGAVTITYSSSGCSTSQLYVNMDNTQDSLAAENPSGTYYANWIQAGHSYTFKLYANTARTELLDMVTVVGYGSYSGTIGAEETEVIIPTGSTLGSVELTWGTNGYSTAQVYVKMDGGSETLMTQSPYGTTTPTWIQDGHKYLFNLYANTSKTTLLDSVTIYGRKYAYEVGPDYHAISTDFANDYFLTQYHTTTTRYYAGAYRTIRQIVQYQLQGMANAGVTRLQQSLYVTSPTPNEAWMLHFPMNSQELTNLHNYAYDVSQIRASDGHRLFLDIEFYWTWTANYMIGSPTTTLGEDHLSPTTFKNYITTTYQAVINNVYNVYRPDGKKVVSSISFDNETRYDRPNTLWIFGSASDGYSGLYEGFVSYCLNRGLQPALEVHEGFVKPDATTFDTDDIMSTTTTLSGYPILTGHVGATSTYLTLALFNNASTPIYIPDKINISMYPSKGNYTYSQMITKIFDDFNAVLPSLGVRQYYGITEMYYFTNSTLRAELGAALCAERLRNNRLTLVEFWTCPGGGGPSAYPFDVADYLP